MDEMGSRDDWGMVIAQVQMRLHLVCMMFVIESLIRCCSFKVCLVQSGDVAWWEGS
jgi:hypothetical protein